MFNVSSVKVSIPKANAGEIKREELVSAICNHGKITYIHAGAGFGKTTLLSQAANSAEKAAWITLDGESDVFTFLNIVSKALRQVFSGYTFTVSEYLPFEGKSNFITLLANALIGSIEGLSKSLMVIFDDLHTIEDQQVRMLILCILKYKPANIHICLSSREAPWQELIPLRVRGSIMELTQNDLAFTRNEAIQFLGFDDEHIYLLTEGWPLAVSSFKLLMENGGSAADIPSSTKEALYSYLFYECISRLPLEMVDFLESSSCFEELDPMMLDALTGKKNAKLLLDSLVARNIFTIKTDSGHYRYHTLFRSYLLESTESSQVVSLQNKAAAYYFSNKQYREAAEYAMGTQNKKILEQIILVSYKDYIKNGSFSELRVWFNSLGDDLAALSRELLVAKGAFLSSIGNFTSAKACLDTAIPLLSEKDRELYVEALVHKARVLRNYVSFEESNKLLDDLISRLDDLVSELTYTVVIEKIYNLCWDSQVNEAYDLTFHMIKACAEAGSIKVKAWYERYLSVVYFVAGRMKDAVYYYQRSLELPEHERRFLDLHSIDIYIAKAYQMLGERDKAVLMVAEELQRLRSMGRYEELWLGYLFAAEIHYQNTFINRSNGGSQTFETTMKYFTLADEYAPLYRKTDFQLQWSKMQRQIYGLIFTDSPKESIINEICANLYSVGDYFKTIALARLYSYCAAMSDFPSAVKYAKLSIEIGEKANMMLIPTMSYGLLARIAAEMKDKPQAAALTKRFLQLCHENGIYEYFRMRKEYDPILEFAQRNGIEPEITNEIMAFAGYKLKKVYITTLGGFSISSYTDRQEPLKMRSKKERELLAFLLDAGSEGVTKEQIYEALWYDTESDDVKKLIGVYLAHIKKDLAKLGVENAIVNFERHYSICRDEIAADTDLFEEAAKEFKAGSSKDAAKKILSLYKGEYLSDFEALWAINKRIRYREVYEEALKYCQ